MCPFRFRGSLSWLMQYPNQSIIIYCLINRLIIDLFQFYLGPLKICWCCWPLRVFYPGCLFSWSFHYLPDRQSWFCRVDWGKLLPLMPVKHNTNSMFCIYNFSFFVFANNHLQFGDDVNGENSVTAARIVVHAIRRNITFWITYKVCAKCVQVNPILLPVTANGSILHSFLKNCQQIVKLLNENVTHQKVWFVIKKNFHRVNVVCVRDTVIAPRKKRKEYR